MRPTPRTAEFPFRILHPAPRVQRSSSSLGHGLLLILRSWKPQQAPPFLGLEIMLPFAKRQIDFGTAFSRSRSRSPTGPSASRLESRFGNARSANFTCLGQAVQSHAKSRDSTTRSGSREMGYGTGLHFWLNPTSRRRRAMMTLDRLAASSAPSTG